MAIAMSDRVFEPACTLRLHEKGNDRWVKKMQAALQFDYFKFNIRCLRFVCEFQAERDQNLLWRKMNRNNPICMSHAVHGVGNAHDGINYGLIRSFADQKAFGFPCKQERVAARTTAIIIDAMPSRIGRSNLTTRYVPANAMMRPIKAALSSNRTMKDGGSLRL